MMRFKIDFNSSLHFPFVLYFARKRWSGVFWDRIDTFASKEDAKAHYERIKDLPEYLP